MTKRRNRSKKPQTPQNRPVQDGAANRPRETNSGETGGDDARVDAHDEDVGVECSGDGGIDGAGGAGLESLGTGKPSFFKKTAAAFGKPSETVEAAATSVVPRKQILFPQLPSLSRIMSVVMLVIGILAVGVLFYQVMVGFFVPLFLAALLVVIFRPVYLWFLLKTGRRKRLAAGMTTGLVLFIVLLPLVMLVSVATTQFTVLLSRMNGSASVAMDRVRGQLGLDLMHADHFRELDRIVDTMGIAGPGIAAAEDLTPGKYDFAAKAAELDKAAAIIEYLQNDVPGPVSADEAAERAIANTKEFADQLRSAERKNIDDESEGILNPLLRLNVSEQFEQMAVFTAASIRTWMHLKLGGALQSQLKLLANPDEADFSRLIRGARESLQPRFVRLTSATGSLLAQVLFGMVILVISVYFFLIDGPKMIATLMRLSPMDDEYEHQLLMEFDRTSRAVVLASVASAIVQGILATIGFWICGFEQIVLLLFLTSLMALVPFLGAASVWVPCALWLGVVDQRWLAAALLALWGAGVVSSIDNVIKVYVLHGRSQLHPLFALLSVIGGVSVFGPIGILVGPMVVVFLQTLLEILNHEIRNEDEQPKPDQA
ncbi:AI-2E family transporter [Aporhodopirellula aestuarii]|uniref:AI-2E family transporter n=1 Tax=Aporhodopirellula aestuarii TaxID=2950107 RepID=A0ABT0TXQ9_9BACT|nr:AI-2E family transporter [Aporhodopirellula aestuarii]MCM2369382.1 AI-2E family transporter [Aporhodopirellula aestuarii]